MSDRALIKNVLEIKNFELAKILLEKMSICDLLNSKRDYYEDNLSSIGFFQSKENFNFLADFLFKKGYEKYLRKELRKSKYFCSIFRLSNKRNLVRITNNISKKYWFENGFSALEYAVSNNDMFAVKIIVYRLKKEAINLENIVINRDFFRALKTNFSQQKRNWKILKFLNEEIQGVGETLVKAILDDCFYPEVEKSVLQAVRVFKVENISLSYSGIRNSFKNKKFFFFLYKKMKQEDKNKIFEVNSHQPILNVLSDSGRVDIDVAKFLLKQNLKAINQIKQSN